MSIRSPLSEFCDARGISGQIKSAFGAYIRSVYSQKFLMSESGETVHLIVNRMSQEDLDDAWQDFVKDLAKYLTQRPK
jgi:hypothetical protein